MTFIFPIHHPDGTITYARGASYHSVATHYHRARVLRAVDKLPDGAVITEDVPPPKNLYELAAEHAESIRRNTLRDAAEKLRADRWEMAAMMLEEGL